MTKRAKQRNSKMSRQPPLPAGLPPRPSGPADSYRPQQPDRSSRFDEHYDDYSDRYSLRPPREPMYQFRGASGASRRRERSRSPQRLRSPPRGSYGAGGSPPGSSSYRPSYSQDRPPQGRSFDFRYDAPPGVDPSRANTYRPRSPPPRQREYAQENTYNHRQNNHAGAHRGGGRGGYRGRAGPRLASDRDFLKTNRAPTPELMACMEEDAAHAVKYIPVEDVSDSEDASMDESDDEDQDGKAGPPHKKRKTTTTDSDSAPRWSNPDPYTVLPPVDESLKKKKDMVKLIRKARVTSSSEHTTKTEATTDDFISFDFGNDDLTVAMPEETGAGMRGAPTGPRSGPSPSRHENGFHSVNAPALINHRTSSTIQNSQYSSNDHGHTVKASEASQVDLTMRDTPSIPTGPAADLHNSFAALGQLPLPTGPAGKYAAKTQHVIDLTSDPALGSRKRNHSDELKPPPPQLHQPPRGKKALLQKSSGDITSAWTVKAGVQATPWISIDHSDTTNMGVWLHKEIMDWYHHVKPRDFEQVVREKLVQDLNARVRDSWAATAEMRPFGSFPAGLYLPTADMDMVCVSQEYMQGGYPRYGGRDLLRFRDFLVKQGLQMKGSIEVIKGAKVPLVKYVDRSTGLKVDISFENDTGLIANKTFQDWKTKFPAMPIIVTLIKHLLAMRGLNEPVNGGIGGFSVTCLVVSLLQNMPQVQSGTMIPEHHLGEILMEFLDLYGNQFNVRTTAIQLNPPGYVSKNRLNIYKGTVQEKFCIIDPNNDQNDIAGGSKNTETICQTFSDAFRSLQKRMSDLLYADKNDRRHQSILGCIVGGDYSSFEWQRNHLAHIYETKYRSAQRD